MQTVSLLNRNDTVCTGEGTPSQPPHAAALLASEAASTGNFLTVEQVESVGERRTGVDIVPASVKDRSRHASQRDSFPHYRFTVEETDDDMDGPAARVVDLVGGYRLRAARLAAGYIVSKDAATALGETTSTYRNIEYGLQKITPTVLASAITEFGVSKTFLKEGTEGLGVNDALAMRLYELMPAAQTDDAARTARLRQMRVETGYESASAAARAKDWKLPTFMAHESGVAPLTGDRAIGYALAFGYRPEWMILGTKPSKDSVSVTWKEKTRVKFKRETPKRIPWLWTRDLRRNTNDRKIALVEYDGNRITLSSLGYIVVPTEDIQGNDKVFGIANIEGDQATVTILAIRPPRPGETGLAFSGGKLIIHEQMPAKIPDPLSESSVVGKIVPLGTKLKVVTLKTDQD